VAGFWLILEYWTHRQNAALSTAGIGFLMFGSASILIAVYFVRKNIHYVRKWLNKAPDES
jgi:hypothetical protein